MKYTKMLKFVIVYLTTLIGIFFLFQESIISYWQQKYHQAFPITLNENLEIIKFIKNTNESLKETLAKKISNLQSSDEHIKNKINSVYSNIVYENNNYVSKLIADDFGKKDEKNVYNLSDKFNSNSYFINSEYRLMINNFAEILLETQNNKTNNHSIIEKKKELKIRLKQSDKVLFIGDSMMQGIAPRVKRLLYQEYKIESIDISKQSTGLSYPNIFNWPKTVSEMLQKQNEIKVLAVFLGPNDPWSYRVKEQKDYLKFKTNKWEESYRSRIRSILESAKQHDVKVIWLGAPCMKDNKLHENMVYLNTLYKSEIELYQQFYLPTSDLLGCSDANYSNTVKQDTGQVKVRLNDGIHFTVSGQKILANNLFVQFEVITTKEYDE